jgi:alcohol dehydrogenase class IV
MVTAFEFSTAGRIVFGPGKVREAGSAARSLGRSAFLVTGAAGRRAGVVREPLAAKGIAVEEFAVAAEPSVWDAAAAVESIRRAGCDLVIGFGGGSAVDLAKAAAALAPNPGEVADFLEVIGRGEPLVLPPLPCLAIPTTAGTGSEVTRNAVLASPAHGLKVSLRGPHLLPRVAIVDPLLTYSLSPALTAATGMDALTQLIEPYVSCRANPITDSLCAEGLRRAGRSLRRAFIDGSDSAAREDMAIASLFGGLALANAGLGAAHAFTGPIGGGFAAPHGALCGALLAPSMEVNLRAAHRRLAAETERRYGEIARILTGGHAAAPADGVAWVRELAEEIGIPRLRTYGVGRADFPSLAAKAAGTSSMKGNPFPLAPDECAELLELAL